MCIWQWSTPVREWKRFPRTHQLHDLQVSTHSALCKPLLSASQASEKLLLWKQTCSTVAWVWALSTISSTELRGWKHGEKVCVEEEGRVRQSVRRLTQEQQTYILTLQLRPGIANFHFFFFLKRQLKLTIPRAHKSNKNIVKRNPNHV